MDTENSKMKIVEFSEDEALKIVDFVKPRRDDFYSYQNLNLLYGAYNEEKDFTLTLTYYLSDGIKRCGEPDDYTYLILKNGNPKLFISCTGRGDATEIVSHLPTGLSKADVLEAISFYNKGHHYIENWYELKQERIQKFVLDNPKAGGKTREEKPENEMTDRAKKKLEQKQQQNKVIGIIALLIGMLFLIGFALFPEHDPKYMLCSVIVQAFGFYYLFGHPERMYNGK